ncbi:hypothetical protein HG535_0F00360 [Zygotorulaspora mrakii]|uniref:Protein Zds1 C-terminal domain-containing protein n=1 Tax=Zygotorulaspora mrakii TaxID=42260 RepID=A0A7H9B570_ZYGMR|nr:uncharacterized protein HG535_0F00360 [Zygotorulaspora mrakii]QLG73526.1 hypothetical protein HG535_0F00360 [Zygotorulaspora mrakii]
MDSNYGTGEGIVLRGQSTNRVSLREKRKSEVLIAAKSLDNEVQNVKNLKRISIGSIDLLMDPELEYRVNATSSTSIQNKNRNSWSSGSSSGGDIEENDRPDVNDSNSGKGVALHTVQSEDSFENSFEATTAEYLDNEHGNSESEENKLVHSQELEPSPFPANRDLSGVGSLRRGAHKVPTRRPSSNRTSNSNTSSSTSLTQNLLWVPADQHPNVKPENYLELVQDTLHNIKLEDKTDHLVETNANKENLDVLDKLPADFSRKHESLVRRPSGLRKSYTEFENELDVDSEIEWQTRPRSSTDPARPISLKDITEELTKISNKAGLTDSDAVTLARTLSMSGSFGDDESLTNKSRTENTNSKLAASVNEDDEFASNMFMKHGFVIPARSSLRRSKFNTYRKRTMEGTLQSDRHTENSGNAACDPISNHKHLEMEPKVISDRSSLHVEETEQKKENVSLLTNLVESNSSITSPSAASDFQDLYDHYRQSSIDWQKEGEQKSEENAQELIEDNTCLKNVRNESRDSPQKKNDWPWMNDMESEKTSPNAKQLTENNDVKSFDDDFIKATKHSEQEFERLAPIRSNHSKNRHQPILLQKDSKPSPKKTPDNASKNKHSEESTALSNFINSSTSDKRQRLEMKFVSLFKRKGKSKSKSVSSTSKKHPHSEPKGKVSSQIGPDEAEGRELQEEMPVFSRNSKNTSKIKSESKSENRLRSVPHDYASIHKSNQDKEELPALKPAVSVASTKNDIHVSNTLVGPQSDVVIESVQELDGDDSQDTSLDQSYNMHTEPLLVEKDLKQEKSIISNPNDNHGPPAAVLPPRKLRFEDVQKPEKPNAPIQFSDSAFGFPLPMLTVSTVIMFDHRLPVNVERAIYRLSHLKLSDPKRELRQQVILSNFMYAYLNLVNHTLYMEQASQDQSMISLEEDESNAGSAYRTEHNAADGAICIPEI